MNEPHDAEPTPNPAADPGASPSSSGSGSARPNPIPNPLQDPLSHPIPNPIPNPLHQRASHADLRRFPPRTEACRAVRALLRDYADGELPESGVRSVQEHVHGCADCDRALSRTELELLRIRRAFAEAGRDGEPSRDFTASVMARVRAAADAEAEAERLADLRDFTPRVVARARASLPPLGWARRAASAAWRGERAFWVPAAAALLITAIGALLWFTPGLQEPAELRIVAAEQAYGLQVEDRRELRRELQTGSEMALPARVGTGVRGQLRAMLPNGGALALGHDSDATVAADRIEFGRGLATVETPRALRLQTQDGEWTAQLAPGKHTVTRERVQRLDGLGGREFAWRIQLETAEGSAVARAGDAPPLRVEAGHVATFTPGQSPVLAATAARIASDLQSAQTIVRAPSRGGPAASSDAWAGRVVDELTAEGLGDVHVHWRSARGAQALTTDGAGRFVLRGLSGSEGALALVRLSWDAAAQVPYPDLGPLPIRLLDAGRIAGHEGSSLAPLTVPRERVAAGRILDEHQRPLAGARITPLVVDELTGATMRLDARAVTADEAGTFRLRRLPSSALPLQRLALLVEADGQVPAVFHEPAGMAAAPRDQALWLQLPPSRARLVRGLPAGGSCTLLEGYAGVPAGSLVRRHAVQADAAGRVLLRAMGVGPCWIVLPDGEVAELHPVEQSEELAPGAPPAAPVAQRLRAALASGRGEGLFAGGAQRFARLAPATEPARFVTVRDIAATTARSGFWIFAQPQDGTDWWLLGEFDGRHAVGMPALDEPSGLIAVGADGSIGMLSVDAVEAAAAAGTTMLEIPVASAGRIEAGAEFGARAAAAGGWNVRIVREGDGRHEDADATLLPLELVRRFDSAGRSQAVSVPPGRYRCELPDGSTRVLTVPAAQRALLD